MPQKKKEEKLNQEKTVRSTFICSVLRLSGVLPRFGKGTWRSRRKKYIYKKRKKEKNIIRKKKRKKDEKKRKR